MNSTKTKKTGKKTTKIQPKKKMGKWKPEFYVRCYEMAKGGLLDAQIAKSLGVSPVSFLFWVRKKPALKKALEEARNVDGLRKGQICFRDYIYSRLSPELKEVWEEVNRCDEEDEDVEALTKHMAKKTMMHLFLYALVDCNFNQSEACRKVGISMFHLSDWNKNHPEFKALIKEMHWHKANFFEAALVKLVMQGDSAAVIFANKTHNRDRGYNEKVDVNISHTIKHSISISEMDKIPLETRKIILDALRAKQDEPKLLEMKKSEEVDIPDAVIVPSHIKENEE